MKQNILVFPCGSEIGLEIYRSLKYDIHFNLIGASSVEDHGEFVYENHISNIPFVDSEQFIDAINNIIDKYHIDFIFPAHDSVVLKLAQNKEKIHCKVLTSDKKTCEIARSKRKTYIELNGIVDVPRMYDIDSISEYPVFLKPDVGQGSKGCLVAKDKNMVLEALKLNDSLLILEYLPGKEYTIDCFTDTNGKLIYVQGRERARILNGISAKTYPVVDVRFQQIAEKLNAFFKFTGVWFFQVKEDKEGNLVLMEFAPRIAGTMELNRLQGVNLPLMWCYLAKGCPVSVLKNTYDIILDRALENKYKINLSYENVYIDFDDCLVTDDSVNYMIVAFLYKCLAEGKRIILLSKHEGDLKESLQQSRLEYIFDKIIHISKDDEKYHYIDSNKSIFIDDSFAERQKVHDKLHIQVFSPDMLESLL